MKKKSGKLGRACTAALLQHFPESFHRLITVADVPCGQGRFATRTARLVGGQNAIPHEFPWMVSISRKGGHFCGGTILNSRFVLTAAHCLCSIFNVLCRVDSDTSIDGKVEYTFRISIFLITTQLIIETRNKEISFVRFRARSMVPAGQLRVSLGEYNLKEPEVPASKEERVASIILHPDHKCGKYVDDIALLELARPISWSESVKPACLPVATGKPGYSAFGGEFAKAAGWGWYGEDRSKYRYESINQRTFPCLPDKRADVLQKVDVRVIENNVCREWYASQGKSTRVGEKQMCAGHEEGGRDACWADSGGPLMIEGLSGNKMMVVGIVSSGVGCGRPRLPGLYTRVSEYIPWISQHVLPIR
ncbi:transmembrane protease serine 4-like [Osmia bicornis bicornis]|uniref:transmembrane protease serine 4-like n=1 Tax=Osmia bicornis bicornis TaxID=1437191 RepID=UPI001EAE9922|nr:transmembrane protease serine 4-like [Osmia bicornis bicornis]